MGVRIFGKRINIGIRYVFHFKYNHHAYVSRIAFSKKSAIRKFKAMCNGKYKDTEIDDIQIRLFGRWVSVK